VVIDFTGVILVDNHNIDSKHELITIEGRKFNLETGKTYKTNLKKDKLKIVKFQSMKICFKFRDFIQLNKVLGNIFSHILV
jgi:hypothetical protein